MPIFFQLGLGLAVCNFLLKVSYDGYKLNKVATIYIILAIILMVPSVIFFSTNAYNLKYFLIVIIALLNSYVIARHDERENSVAAWLPLAFLIFILSVKLNLGYNVETVMPENSSNYISISLFGAYLSYFVLTKDFSVRKVHVVFLLIISMLCILAQGRAGTILGLVLLLSGAYTVFTPSFTMLSKGMRRLISSLTLAIILVAFVGLGYYLYVNGYMTKLAQRGLYNAPRLFLILNYINAIEIQNFFFGLNVYNYPPLGKYGFNLHNNYLNLHSLYGLAFTLFYIYIIIYIARWMWKEKHHHVFMGYMIIVARAFTDTQIFSGRFDYLFFAMFVYCVIQSRKQKSSTNPVLINSISITKESASNG